MYSDLIHTGWQVVTHSATFDFWPAMRHALRATPHGEKPRSVAAYERETGKMVKDGGVEDRGVGGTRIDRANL